MATVSTTIDGYPYFLEKGNGAVDPIYYSATDMRIMLASIISKQGALGNGSAMRVTQAANVGMSIIVQPGAYMLGSYLCYLPAATTIDLFTFSSSPSATRTHRVYLAVYDGQQAGTEYAAKIVVQEDTGSGAGSPVGATVAGQLATIAVAKNQGNIQNANITDTRQHGGVASNFFALYTYLNAAYFNASGDNGTAPFRGQVNNGTVRLSGSIKRTNGKDFAAGSTYELGALSSNLWPTDRRFLVGACGSTTQTWRLQIDRNGAMTAVVGTATPSLIFDGMTYELD